MPGSPFVGSGAIGKARQGASVSMSGMGLTLAWGGPDHDMGVGGTWLFQFLFTLWYEQEAVPLVGNGILGNDGPRQGTSVSLDYSGATLIVGGPAMNGTQGGSWIFQRSLYNWIQSAGPLIGTENDVPLPGDNIIFPYGQGISVSMSWDGLKAAVGSANDRYGLGSTWIFDRDGYGAPWHQVAGKIS